MWTTEKYQEFVKELYSMQDIKYQEFSKNIIFDNTIIGIRTPILKKIAKDISKGDYNSFLKLSTNNTYEEKMIYGFVVSNIKDFNIFTKNVDNFKYKINNWALCDMFCAASRIVIHNKEAMYQYILDNLSTTNMWIKRMCFVFLLDYYIEPEYLDRIFELCDTYNSLDYYVQMSIAWLISICYIKYSKETKKYLQNCKLDDFTYNKAIQKTIESRRITNEEKEKLRKMKRGKKYENINSK